MKPTFINYYFAKKDCSAIRLEWANWQQCIGLIKSLFFNVWQRWTDHKVCCGGRVADAAGSSHSPRRKFFFGSIFIFNDPKKMYNWVNLKKLDGKLKLKMDELLDILYEL